VTDPQDSPIEDNWNPGPEADIRRLEAIEVELAGVDAALRRLDEGSYGACEVCGAPLDGEVIERHPLADRCPAHVG